MGSRGSNVYAFYSPKAGGSFAIVPRVKTSNSQLDMPMLALLHEYAHHFLMSSNSHAWPRWFSEGAAEFFSSAQFGKGGNVQVGKPALHRSVELLNYDDVTAEHLLNPHIKNKGVAFYGKSWLLYHYLTFSQPRAGQLSRYLNLLRQGTEVSEAGKTAFGSFSELDRELRRYLTQRRMLAFDIPAERLRPGSVELRALRAGEAAAMPLRIRLKNHRSSENIDKLLAEVRTVAAQHPTEAAASALLAEAEYVAGNDKEAIEAANATIALDATNVDGYLVKGYALFRQAESAEDRTTTYAQARRPFLDLNKLENDHPIPLAYFYRSFIEQGQQPTENAIDGLKGAVTIAPFDLNLRMMLATQQMQDRKFEDAQINLGPIAFNPHGGESAELAQRLLDVLKDHDPAEELDVHALMNSLKSAGSEEGDGDEAQQGPDD